MSLQRLSHRFSILIAALWWGGITAISFLVVPFLFVQLGNPAVAGPLAARLFAWQCGASVLLGVLLLLLLRRRPGVGAPSAADGLANMSSAVGTMGFVLLAMLLALLQQFGVAQQIVSARATGGDLRLWHSLGSAMVLGQWLCAGAVLWRLSRRD